MKAIRTTVSEGDFRQLLTAAITGDVIILHEGSCIDWEPHEDGIVIWCSKGLLLNGETVLYKGVCTSRDAWLSFRRGVVVFWDGQWLFNGDALDLILPEAVQEAKERSFHLQSEITVKDGKFVLSNGTILYEGPYDEYRFCHQGVAIRQGNRFSLIVYKA